MTDRPDFDPEKTFEEIRAQWTKESHLSLPSKLEARLTLIEKQLSTLFQLVEKLLHEALDQTIDSDVNQDKFRDLDRRIHVVEEWIGVETDEIKKRFEVDE